ncbi:MAG TPA: Flp family type IVb pilin [Mycobacteriales bacterium]|nr:Flp family type IVb pilin [Mycobacteriales bacterium]
MLQYLRNVVAAKKDEGASAVEYGLLVAAIAALIVVIVFALGHIIQDVFGKTCDNIRSNTSGTTVACNR